MGTLSQPALDAELQRGRRLELLTIGYNCIEGVVSLVAGWQTRSISLIGFGIDSMIELTSGFTMLWRLGQRGSGAEARALRIVGCSFLALAAWVAWESIESLRSAKGPAVSVAGMVIATLSAIVMPWIARAKRRVGRSINSGAMIADSRQTELCAYLSIVLLAGLGLNALFGWWWADAVAGLIMVPIIAREGWDALSGKHCGDCAPCH